MLKVTQVIGEKETHKVDFKILVKDYEKLSMKFEYGNQVFLRGIITKPKGIRNPGGFDYKKYLSHKNIFYIFYLHKIVSTTEPEKGNIILRSIIYPVRRYMIEVIDKMFPSPSTRSIIQALILGDKELIPEYIWESFSKTGIIHILAVSGLHVGFVLVICMTLFNLFRFSPVIRIVLTIIILVFYTLLTEFHPPVFRAAVMSSLYLGAIALERKIQPFNIIGLAGLILILINPYNLFSLSFILTFTAISSIVYFYDKLINLPLYLKIKSHHPWRAKLLATFFISFSALIGTLPISAYYFNRIPLLSLLINLVAIPLAALIVGLSFITIFFSTISLYVASIYAGLVDLLISSFVSVITWIAHFKLSYLTVPSPHIGIIILYFLGFFLMFNFNVLKYRKYLIFMLLLCLNILIWNSVIDNHSSQVQWIQFDVGQGDAALLITPRRKTILIDGGLKSRFFDNGKQIISVYLHKKGFKKINYVILTHPHSDHVGGLLHIIENFNIDRIYFSNCFYETPMYDSFLKAVKQRNIELYEVTSPDSLILSTCKLYFLSPSKHQKNKTKKVRFNANNQSLVTYFMYGKTKFLFMGDAEREIEKEIIQTYHALQCNVIKIGHHGSSTSSTYAFLKQVDPDLGIISVGENNHFHLPSELVLQYLELLDIDIHRTDKQGAAVLISDGSTISKVDWK